MRENTSGCANRIRIASRYSAWLMLLPVLCLHAQTFDSVKPALEVQSAHTIPIEDAAFSPDGHWLITVDNHNPPIAKVWELASGRLLRTFTIDRTAGIQSIAAAPDNQTIAASEYAGLSLWNFKTGQLSASLGERAHGDQVAFSPNGKVLAGTSNIGGLFIWSLATRSITSGFTLKACPCEFQFSHDGKLLAWASSRAKKVLGQHGSSDVPALNAVQLWDVAKGRKILTLDGPTAEVLSIVFSPDDHTLYSASADHTIRSWNVATGVQVGSIHWDGKDARLSPDARWSATLNADGDTELREIPNGRLLRKVEAGRGIFAPDGGTFAALGLGATLFQLPSGREGQVLGGAIEGSRAMAVSPDGTMLATGESGGFRVWFPASGNQQFLRDRPSAQYFHALAFNADSRLLAAATDNGYIDLWDTRTWKTVRRVAHEDRGVSRLAFSPDGAWLASSPSATRNEKKITTLYALNQQAQPPPLEGRLAGFTKDGQVVTHDSKTIRFFDPRSGQLIRSFADEVILGTVQSDFSPDGRWIATAGECCEITIRDISTGRRIWQLSDVFDSVRFSPDGRWLAGRRVREGVEIWDIARRQKVYTIPAVAYQFAFWPNSKFLVTNNSDGSTTVWEVPGGRKAALMVAGSGSAEWIAVTPEGLFDGSNRGIQNLVAWRIGDRTYTPDRFFSQFYSPGLLSRVFGSAVPKPEMDLATLKLPPEVHILSPASGTSQQNHVAITIRAEDKGGGLSQVRLFQNSKLVGTRDAGASSGRTGEFRFDVELVPKENVFTATAINRERTESNPDTIHVELLETSGPKGSALYVLAVGINAYEDSKFHLEFARQDAEAIAGFFRAHGRQLFQSVSVRTLIDKEATRENIVQALADVAARAVKDDVVILYLAGHGTALGQQFYFLTQGMHTDLDMPGTIRKFGLSDVELGAATFRIRALKQLLVIDACQSGAALPTLAKSYNTRGVGSTEQKAAEMLARSNGLYLILASTTEQYAIEVPQLGHGVLAYALLSGLGEKAPPQAPTTGGFVTVLSLLQYVNQKVPELTEQYEDGQRQYPVSFSTGMDFPLFVYMK